MNVNGNIAERLLDWYDRKGRDLPWRVRPNARASEGAAEPYRVWLSEIMLQQTTVSAVTPYFYAFTKKWPCVQDLAHASDDEIMAAWAGLGYYARARNLVKTARIVAFEFGGVFPDTYELLIALPGVGPYTAAAIAAIAFERPEAVVDGNVERVIARLKAVNAPLPAAQKTLYSHARALTPQKRPGDYAQAMMDLGATLCKRRAPDCKRCPLNNVCLAFAQNIAPDLPRRSAKAPKPTRCAHFFVTRRPDGAWLLERRAEKGLLGGMLAWPSSEWGEVWPATPLATKWHPVAGELRHTFTHFHLIGRVFLSKNISESRCEKNFFIPAKEFSPEDLPSLMRKVHHLAEKAM